jgi:hypothetical protein
LFEVPHVNKTELWVAEIIVPLVQASFCLGSVKTALPGVKSGAGGVGELFFPQPAVAIKNNTVINNLLFIFYYFI